MDVNYSGSGVSPTNVARRNAIIKYADCRGMPSKKKTAAWAWWAQQGGGRCEARKALLCEAGAAKICDFGLE